MGGAASPSLKPEVAVYPLRVLSQVLKTIHPTRAVPVKPQWYQGIRFTGS